MIDDRREEGSTASGSERGEDGSERRFVAEYGADGWFEIREMTRRGAWLATDRPLDVEE
jgi:hypothetical protein